MLRLQLGPRRAVETPRIIQQSIRCGVGIAAEKDQRFALWIVNQRAARPRRRRLRRLQPVPAYAVKDPCVIQDADRIVPAENDELRIRGIKRHARMLAFAQRGGAELTPVLSGQVYRCLR